MYIRIGARIEKEKTTNKWVMYFSNMSGDGDHYETTTKEFPDGNNPTGLLNDMMNLLDLYTTSWRMKGNDKYDEDKVLEEIKRVGKKLGFEDPVDEYYELVGNDITCEGRSASPQEAWISYFDRYGDEHMTELLTRDKVHMGRFNESNFKEILDEHRYIFEDRG